MEKLILKDAGIIRNKRLVRRDILISGGKIRRIGKLDDDAKVIDCKGKLVLPGIIDPHVHMRDPGFTHKEDIRTATRAAVKGGVTTVLDMPNTNPPTITIKDLEDKRRIAARKAVCNYGFHFGAYRPDEIQKLTNTPAIKVYMNITTGKMIQKDEKKLLEVFRSYPRIAVHAEEETIDHAGRLTQRAGNILYVCHVSCEKDLRYIRKYRRILGRRRVYAEVAPHHLFMDESYVRKLKGFVMMKPSLKKRSDRLALWKAIRDGEIDTIGTDHAPHTIKEKSAKNPPFGVPGLETSLMLMLDSCSRGKLQLWKLQKLMCENPAKIFHLESKGYIRVGYDADLVIVDTKKEKKIQNKDMVSRCSWTPFAGQSVRGVPVTTIVKGKIAYDKGRIFPIHGDEVKVKA